jgi:hypothetical protein
MAGELVSYEGEGPQKKKRKPRRRKLQDPWIRKAYLNAISAGLSNNRAAELVGIDPKTATNELLRNSEFSAEVRHASALRELRTLNIIHAHSLKSWEAAKWFLAHWNRDAWGDKKPDLVTRGELLAILNNLAASMVQGLDPDLAKTIAERFDAIIKAVGGEREPGT